MSRYSILTLFILILLVSCNNKSEKDRLLASYNNHKLYESEVIGFIPQGASSSDSIQLAELYINNWLEDKIILNEALKTLNPNQRDFKDKVRRYRNSLLIFEWEKQLLEKKIADEISQSKILEYYKNNQHEFILQDDIIRVLYIKLNNNNPYIPRAIEILNSPALNIEEARQFCRKYAVNYLLNPNVWLFVDDILKEVPLTSTQRLELLSTRNVFQISDIEYRYLLKPLEVKLKGTPSPLALEEATIKEILIHKRKQEIIETEISKLKTRDKNKGKIRIY